MGLIYRTQGKGNKALDQFKSVVEDFPNTAESREALGLAKIQFAELDQLTGYVDWIQTLTGTDIGQGQLDSTLYNGAYDRYSFGDCEGTLKGMTDYLNKFPDGIFRVRQTITSLNVPSVKAKILWHRRLMNSSQLQEN